MKKLLALIALGAFQMGFAQKTIELKSFKGLAASGNIELVLVKSSENRLVIEKGDADDLKIGNENNSLALSTERSTGRIKATVYYNSAIESIAAAAGIEISGKDSIQASKCSISAASGCEITLAVAVDNLTTAAASGAELNADKLMTGDTVVSVASGAEASIHSTGIVNATVASSAELNIHGNPKEVKELKARGGEINIIR